RKRLIGLYADINVGYKNLLFLGLTARNDWSSTLPPAHRSFFYPGINTSYIFSELLKQKAPFLSYGKLRASWAQVGNDANPYLLQTYWNRTQIIGPYGSTQFPFNGIPGFSIGRLLGNPNLKPEITTASEIGTELSFLKNR